MCGIYSVLNCNFDPNKISLYKAAFDKASSRGPDHSYFNNIKYMNLLIGFHRLAINGIDNKSNQPIIINNKLLICNGEIYNHKELEKMFNITTKTNSDCEIIIHLYEKFGFDKMIHFLDGVFAMILVDFTPNKQPVLFVARDSFGVRPLYIGVNDSITLASTINQFDHMGYYTSLDQFLPGSWRKYQLNNNKIWEEVMENVFFNVYSIQSSIITYDTPEITDQKLMGYSKIVHDHLSRAVKKRVHNTDRPVACLLSGGLDSSIITALVCKYYQTSERKLETYSIGMEGSPDLKYARDVANFLNTNHTEVLVTEEEFIDAIPEVIRAIGSYDTTTVRASIGNYLLGKYISLNSKAKVIFNGDGSDEVTGGYLYFHSSPSELEFDVECKRLVNYIHYFDGLRSDRCISAHGLEPRTPFLDKSFVTMYLSIPSCIRFQFAQERCEKYLLRYAFSAENNISALLPESIIWRRKEAFSDGVSDNNKLSIGKLIENKVAYTFDQIVESRTLYKDFIPQTGEQLHYRNIYFNIFRHLKCIPYFWMPMFVNATDPSARTLENYDS